MLVDSFADHHQFHIFQCFHGRFLSLSPAQESAMETLEDMELVMIRKAIDKHEGNLSAVASQLGITRQTLYNKMKKYGL